MKKILNTALPFLAAAVLFTSCDKNKVYKTKEADPEAHFAGAKNQRYLVVTNPSSYDITVGTTDVVDVDRVINVGWTLSSQAVLGTDFTIVPADGKVTIPAGQATAKITVNGVLARYLALEKDTVTFFLKQPSEVKLAGFQDTVRLAMRGPCLESEVNTDLQTLVGEYGNTLEVGFNNTSGAQTYVDGPYTTEIKSINQLGPNTADIVVANLFNANPQWADVTLRMDWTSLTDRRITLLTQQTVGDAGQLNPAYTGMALTANPLTSANPAPVYGTYSFCSGTFKVKFRLCVPALGGCFGTQYNWNLAR